VEPSYNGAPIIIQKRWQLPLGDLIFASKRIARCQASLFLGALPLFICRHLSYILLHFICEVWFKIKMMKEMLILEIKRLCLLLSLVSLFALTEPAMAGDVPTLSLNDLIRMALDYSPLLKESEQDIMAAQSDLAQAKAGQWAQMEVFALTTAAQQADLPTVLNHQLINNDKDSYGIFGALDFLIVQPLFTFGKISHRQNAAKYGLLAQKAAKEKRRAEVVLNVKELYFAMIVANQGIGAANDANRFVKDARQRIERLLAAGSPNATEVDLYRLDTFESDIKTFKAKAESGARVASLALKKTVGIKEDQDIQLDLKDLPTDTRAMDAQDDYIRKAMERRPELVQLKHGIEARKSLVEAAEADLYPTFFIAGVGSFAGTPGRERMPISYFNDRYNHGDAGGFLGTTWHFDLGIGKAKIDKAKAEHQKLLRTRDYAEQNIPLEVAKYYQDVLESQNSFEAYEKGMIAARKWIVSAFANFDIGVGTAYDMFYAIERYGKNRGDYLRALYSYHIALAKLSYAIGEHWSVAEDVASK
jgi:outer membrane protein